MSEEEQICEETCNCTVTSAYFFDLERALLTWIRVVDRIAPEKDQTIRNI